MTRDLVGKCLENPENHSKFLFFFICENIWKKKKKNMRKKKNNFMCETDSFGFFLSGYKFVHDFADGQKKHLGTSHQIMKAGEKII